MSGVVKAAQEAAQCRGVLRLAPVVKAIADEYRLHTALVVDEAEESDEETPDPPEPIESGTKPNSRIQM